MGPTARYRWNRREAHVQPTTERNIQGWNKKISFYRSIDCYDIDVGGQASYHDGRKMTFSLWRKWIRTVECGILAIKKFGKSLQIGLQSVFLNVPIKHVHEKEKEEEIWL